MRHATLILLLVAGMCGCGKVSAQNDESLQIHAGDQMQGGIKTGNVTGPGGVKDGLPCETAPQSSDELRLRGVWKKDAKGSLVCTPLAGAPAPPFDVAPLPGNEQLICRHEPFCRENELEHGTPETCAEKSRVLLHSEDGKGHCISLKAWEER